MSDFKIGDRVTFVACPAIPRGTCGTVTDRLPGSIKVQVDGSEPIWHLPHELTLADSQPQDTPQDAGNGAGGEEVPGGANEALSKRIPDRSTILTTAETLINGDRARDYGDASTNFRRIAELWSPILETTVTPEQVALCMAQLKIARLITTPTHQDSWIEACGYLALGGEIAGKGAA